MKKSQYVFFKVISPHLRQIFGAIFPKRYPAPKILFSRLMSLLTLSILISRIFAYVLRNAISGFVEWEIGDIPILAVFFVLLLVVGRVVTLSLKKCACYLTYLKSPKSQSRIKKFSQKVVVVPTQLLVRISLLVRGI